jgi:dihydroflavonol-4-reductase
MNTFLVTGSTGFLGHHVIKLLNMRGVRPRVLLPIGIDPNSPKMKALKEQNVEIAEGDISE